MIPTFRTLFCVVEYFLLETHTLNNLPAKEGIRSSRMLGFARMGTSQTNAVIRRYSALLVDGALLKVRSDRPEMAQYCTNMLQAATSNCACARLSVRNVGWTGAMRNFRVWRFDELRRLSPSTHSGE